MFGVIYHSPSSTAVNTGRLNILIQKAVELNCDYTLILGDFNFATIDWENWSTPHSVNHPEFKFIECLRDNFLSQMVDSPTRHRDGQASNILDLILVDKPEIVNEVSYSNNLGASDHISLLINLSSSPETNFFDSVRRN
ncbi:MAG: hypothetical protein AB2693_19680 [Candidatus Thiodiazotropha sp.]